MRNQHPAYNFICMNLWVTSDHFVLVNISVLVNICLGVELIQTCQLLIKENLETCDKKSGDSTFSPVKIKQTFLHLGY